MSPHSALMPVTVLTGFLGSGKTTLLQRLLQARDLAGTAVLVNEFGDVGLDHLLVDPVAESTLLLENGCVCCAVRDDLVGAIKDLLQRRAEKQIADFERIVIETSGLADPAPIAYTLMTDPVLRHHVRLGNVVTVVDAVNGENQLAHYQECRKQVALADHIILTKSDLTEGESVAALSVNLKRRNPTATITDNQETPVRPESLLIEDLYHGCGKAAAAARWQSVRSEGANDDHTHSHGIDSFSVKVDRPMDWTAFGLWMSMLLHRHGDRILRVKGLLDVDRVATPVLINGAQHIMHPPAHLPAWPNDQRGSKIVFIVDGMARAPIQRSLNVFMRL